MIKDFRNDTWSKFNEIALEKKIILFGASGIAANYLRYLKIMNSRWKIAGVVDNDTSKHGKEFEGYTIKSPESLKEYNKDDIVILVCSVHTGDIANQLNSMGIENYFSDFWMNTLIKISYKQVVPKDEIEWLKSIVHDEESKKIIDAIVKKRATDFLDYTDIKYQGESEYFCDEFWKPYKNGSEVFVDGGGYTGDTIDEFVNWTRGNYKKIYSFEPDPQKAQIIKDNLWRWNEKVNLYEKGLYDIETRLRFVVGDSLYSGKIDENKDTDYIYIDTAVLDNIIDMNEKITFIKLDIEGAELKALEGARKIITRDKPRLAICIYHKMNDLWEIPKLIKKMVPEYKICIRHCGVRCRGTILYAKIENG